MRSISLRQLGVFAAVAKHLSFARAAEELHLSQPAVSMQVKDLEAAVQLPLFERSGRGVRLTMPGEYFLVYARRVLSTLREAHTAMAGLRGLETGRLTIGMVSTAEYFLPRLLARFLDREIQDLRPYEPRPPAHRRLQRLLKRRALLVKQIQQLRQSFAELPELHGQVRSLIARINRLIAQIDQRTRFLARELGWNADLRRLRTVPGVGPLNALALCAAFYSGEFIHRDPFIAYLGLDVRTKDSGQHKGRRKLTKKGSPECRRLLHNAAMAATRSRGYFQRHYQSLQQRGLSKTAALVVVARKIARLAFGVLRSQSDFCPARHLAACGTT